MLAKDINRRSAAWNPIHTAQNATGEGDLSRACSIFSRDVPAVNNLLHMEK
jgi:hypothetical protein